MTLSSEHLSRLRALDESDLWNLASALMQIQETILSMENTRTTPSCSAPFQKHACQPGRSSQTSWQLLKHRLKNRGFFVWRETLARITREVNDTIKPVLGTADAGLDEGNGAGGT